MYMHPKTKSEVAEKMDNGDEMSDGGGSGSGRVGSSLMMDNLLSRLEKNTEQLFETMRLQDELAESENAFVSLQMKYNFK